MRYRALDENGDYRFGRSNQFLIDSPEAVAQAILTRLKLYTGEWFLDKSEGTDYAGAIWGFGTQGTRDFELQDRILETPGVRTITAYQSTFDSRTREFTVLGQVDTLYGVTEINTSR